jgi:HAD superfamily hydrolase (TIGR01459 family)
MEMLDGIAGLADRYDGFVLDLWGVVHDGRQPYPGVVDALERLAAAGKRVVFLSNAPRRAWFVDRMLGAMGVPRALYAETITSGELVWRHLAERDHPFFATLGRRALHIGPERDLSTIEGLDITLVPSAEEADFVLNTGPDPERGPKSVTPYDPVLREAAARRLPMVVANPDRAVMVAGERLLCAGALADRYAELGGGAVCEIGKPDAAVYAPVLAALGYPPRERVLAIGDSPHTDLAGAQAAGIDAVWALTGLAGDEYGAAPDPAALARRAAEEGVAPIAALRALRWAAPRG